MNEFFRKNILKGFSFSLGLHVLAILLFVAFHNLLKEDEVPTTVVRILKYSELGPPPSILLESVEGPKGSIIKKEKYAIPKPVKRIEKGTIEIASQKPAGDKEGLLDGTGFGNVKVIPEETIKEVKPQPEMKYYAAVDFMPEPKGGYGAIQTRVVVPSQAKENNISGKVLVKSYIDEMGVVVRTEIIQGIGYGCDAAAMRAVRNTRFSPGKLNGQYVRVQMIITVFF